MDHSSRPQSTHWSTFKKSSFSGQGQQECVEVAPWGEVRDSKNPDASFTVPTRNWRTFLAMLRTG